MSENRPYNFNQWRGKPFIPCGRGPEAYDCWGLVWAVIQDGLGMTLPSFLDDHERVDPEAHLHLEGWALVQVPQPQPFDVLYFRLAYQGGHVGLAVNGSSFLHTTMGYGSTIDRLYSPWWRCKLEGVYRYAPARRGAAC